MYYRELETKRGAKKLYDDAHKAAAAKRLADVKAKQKAKRQK